MQNPLLNSGDYPDFAAINASAVLPAISKIIAKNTVALESLAEQKERRTWQNFVLPLQEIEERLNRSWHLVSHLNSVNDADGMRQAHEQALLAITAYQNQWAQDRRLYQGFRELAEGAALDDCQRRYLDKMLQDFQLAGITLPRKKQKKVAELLQDLAQLGSKFEQNLLDATACWWLEVTEKTNLSGLPEMAVTLARQEAEASGLEGWKFTLQDASYITFMSHSTNPELRKRMYKAFVTRASNRLTENGFDNEGVIRKILRKRQKLAKLLGYANFAEYALVRRMVSSPAEVDQFLHTLLARGRPHAEQEFTELQTFAIEHDGNKKLQPWDLLFYRERYKEARLNFNQEALREYFPISTVIDGMFKLVEKLFAITLEEVDDVAKWHPSVQCFSIRNNQGTPLGHFYMDLYAREHKRGGAWMAEGIQRYRRSDEQIQLPMSFLTCNFTPPIAGQYALLTFEEVLTLFHEFGHTLHHLLTTVEIAAISGINGVPWDAVELPSQFLENFCWNKSVLKMISGHYQTGKCLPEEDLSKLIRIKTFHAGMQLLRQLEFSMLDMAIHGADNPDLKQISKQIRAKTSLLKIPDYNRSLNSFGHIFAGGYAAGYYSYKWAETLSADAFSRFEEEGLLSRKLGLEFRDKILSIGGSVDIHQAFVAFRKRPPSIDSLLRHCGLAQASVAGLESIQ